MLDFLNKDHIKYDFVDIKQESVETEVPQDSIATQSSSETEEIVQNVSEPPTPTESEPKKRKAEATDEETEENSNMFQRVMKRLTLNSIQEQLDSDEAVGLLVTQDLKKLDEDLKAEAVPEIVGIMMEYRKKQLKRRNR
ncbi:uncharacterized protein LOC115624272 [Scaptodrosophila lebanonensis]|uniref:Uncharacterized protein LOC115624272 n=1 Tax=Drosophila lebanonensis TaxID=7225 RepID=A0A6J2TFI2_DROLE|nr:uncharacterized protein LOC115624272 [Scaptodrosophila lebanonensis]